ncbi:hypothetical protein HYD85_02425 [Mycoplasmopsis bovis]|nr:hypothetical protein HYD85_02425 [Mycoplasmopsis bovis]
MIEKIQENSSEDLTKWWLAINEKQKKLILFPEIIDNIHIDHKHYKYSQNKIIDTTKFMNFGTI